MSRITDLENTLLALDRDRELRDRTVALESKVDIDILLFGHILYEMATGVELMDTVPSDSVLEMLHSQVEQVLRMIFHPSASPRSVSDFDDVENKSTVSNSSVIDSISSGLVSIYDLRQCSLFTEADVPDIDLFFTGFRLDSSMKCTIKNSMRINYSRNQAHVLHYEDKQALVRARQRAERRVLEDKDKQQQRIRQFAAGGGAGKLKKSVSATSTSSLATTPPSMRRKLYRADSVRALQRSTSTA